MGSARSWLADHLPHGAPAVPADPRARGLVVIGSLTILLLAVVSLVPVPYAMMRPGPVRDVLDSHDGQPLIDIEGHPTYRTSGTLDLLTVSVTGGPAATSTVWDLLGAWADPRVDIRPVAEVFPADRSQEEIDQENQREMDTSQESATAAAMAELGTPVPTELRISGFADGADAARQLRDGDVITGLDGREITDLATLRQDLRAVTPGGTVQVAVLRAGQAVTVPVVTSRASDGRTLLGVLIDPTYHFPYTVRIRIDDIGGPSAGTMFALGIIDKVTPGEMTGGQRIAGTGTITADGTVGPIGGVRQKLAAAAAAGAHWFLAPADNCREIGAVPDGIQVVRIATLHEARVAVETIGAGRQSEIAALPGCG